MTSQLMKQLRSTAPPSVRRRLTDDERRARNDMLRRAKKVQLDPGEREFIARRLDVIGDARIPNEDALLAKVRPGNDKVTKLEGWEIAQVLSFVERDKGRHAASRSLVEKLR